MSDSNDNKHSTRDVVERGPALPNGNCVLKLGWSFSDGDLRKDFTSFFIRHFNYDSSDEGSRFHAISALYVNEFGMSPDEANAKAQKLCDGVASMYAGYAAAFFAQNVGWVLRHAAFALAAQSEAFARVVLDGLSIEVEDGPISECIHDNERDALVDNALDEYFADVRSHFKKTIKATRAKIEQETSGIFFNQMLEFCREVAGYHKVAKAEFEARSEFRHRKPSHDQWMIEWLRRAKEQFGARGFHGIKDPVGYRSFSDDFFKHFASLDSTEANPRNIALNFAATAHGKSPSHYQKRVLPKASRTKRRKKNVRK